MRSPSRLTPLLALALPLSAGCGASYEGDDDAWYGDASPTYAPDPGAATPTEPELPDESGDSFYRAAPAVTDRFVYVVNPDRDTVTKINATTQAVYTLPVGAHPTQVLVGTADASRAAVLNEADATVTILATADDAATVLPIHPDTNFMALRADGRYAITWYSASVEGASTSVDGARSYSSITVVSTGDGAAAASSTPLTLGLNPRAPQFIGEDQALVLCDEAVALVTLTDPPSARLLALTDDPDEAIEVEEIKISEDGRFAWIRTGAAELLVVDLSPRGEGQVTRLSLPGVPTDLEMTSDRLIVVDRGNSALLVYDPLDPSVEPEVIPTPTNQIVGAVAVAPEVGKALLYTTLTQDEVDGTALEDIPLARFSVWDLGTDEIRVRDLVKPVAAITLNHNADLPVAAILHQGDAASDQPAFDGREAFSQYYFDDGLTVPAVLEAPTRAIADSPSGDFAYMILEDTLNVVVVDYRHKQIAGVPVQSAPVFVGILTGTELGWVSQQHDLGRISFIEPESLTVTTITGFELNAQP